MPIPKIVVIPTDFERRSMECLEYICEYVKQERQSPSIPELSTAFKVHEGTIHHYINWLKEKGFISKIPNFKRSIRVINEEYISKYKLYK